MPTPTEDSAVRRGFAARQMIVEDTRWAIDVIRSCLGVPGIQGAVPLILGHHIVRIAYEGALALRSPDPQVGIPEMASLIGDRFSSVTERMRHTSKVLDNSSTSYEAMLAELDDLMRQYHDRFTGNSHRWFRWLETDFGMFHTSGVVLGATIPAAYRMGFDLSQRALAAGEIREVSEEWGGALRILEAAGLDGVEQSATIDFRKCRVGSTDHLAVKYLAGRFDDEFATGLKLLLVMIEGDLNVADSFLPLTSRGHEMAVFRARVVAVHHSLSSLKKISEKSARRSSAGLAGLRSLLDDAPTRRLLATPGKKVRDRCVHYPILNPTFDPDASRPMFGLVESLRASESWESFYRDVKDVGSRLSEHLASWKPEVARRGRSRSGTATA